MEKLQKQVVISKSMLLNQLKELCAILYDKKFYKEVYKKYKLIYSLESSKETLFDIVCCLDILKKYKKEIKILNKLIHKYPEDNDITEWYYYKSRAHMNMNEEDNALNDINEGLKYKKSIMLLEMGGLICTYIFFLFYIFKYLYLLGYDISNYKMCISYYNDFLKYNENKQKEIEAKKNIIYCYIELNENIKAIECMKSIMKYETIYIKDIGDIYYKMNNFKDAIYYYKLYSIHANKKNGDYLSNKKRIIIILEKLKLYDEALEQLKFLIENNINDCNIIYNYARINYILNNYEKAEMYFKKTLSYNHKVILGWSHYYIGKCMELKLNSDKNIILKHYEECLNNISYIYKVVKDICIFFYENKLYETVLRLILHARTINDSAYDDLLNIYNSAKENVDYERFKINMKRKRNIDIFNNMNMQVKKKRKIYK